MQQLSAAGMNKFNKTYKDPPGVPIYSVAGVSSLQSADTICKNSQWGILENIDVMEPVLWATSTVLAESGPKGMKDPTSPPFTSHKMPFMYSTPLRSLVSKDLTNLLFAGRLASFSHVVYGCTSASFSFCAPRLSLILCSASFSRIELRAAQHGLSRCAPRCWLV